MTSTVKQKAIKPSILRAYRLIEAHHEHVKDNVCNSCYARGDSLIIQGDVLKHLSDVCSSVNALRLNFIDELEHNELVELTNIRNDIFRLKLLPLKKEAIA
jgi:hypothetical protein